MFSRSFDHLGQPEKELSRNSFAIKKKPERPQRSVRKVIEYVIDYTCENAYVKFTNVKSVT